MTIHTFHSELWVPQPRELVFQFFADARNLEHITPPWLNFEVLTPGDLVMQTGTVIDYRLRIRGIPLRWRSEITLWDPPHVFIDEQRRGPYRQWLHRHQFESRNGGTLCIDQVHYAAPGGEWIHRRLVRPDIETIFHHRTHALREQFATK